MERVLLATYGIKIENRNGDPQLLSRFNGADDFLDFIDRFCTHIFENVNNFNSLSGERRLHLTLSSPHTREDEHRCVYGQISTGVSGDKYEIVNLDTNDTEMEVEENHAAFKSLFFYFHIPVGRNIGYLVLQRKAKYGVKTVITKAIVSFLRQEGYMDSRFKIKNFLHNRVYRRMLEFGSLKKVDLIKRKIPNSLEQYIENGREQDEIPGVLKTTFQSGTSLPHMWKTYLDRLFNHHGNDNDRVEIDNLDENYDEIDFTLELNGKRKTFHVVHKNRIQPDVDVTANIERESGEPTIESLIQQSRELIEELLEVNVE